MYIQLAYVVCNASPVTTDLKTSKLQPTQKKARKEKKRGDGTTVPVNVLIALLRICCVEALLCR